MLNLIRKSFLVYLIFCNSSPTYDWGVWPGTKQSSSGFVSSATSQKIRKSQEQINRIGNTFNNTGENDEPTVESPNQYQTLPVLQRDGRISETQGKKIPKETRSLRQTMFTEEDTELPTAQPRRQRQQKERPNPIQSETQSNQFETQSEIEENHPIQLQPQTQEEKASLVGIGAALTSVLGSFKSKDHSETQDSQVTSSVIQPQNSLGSPKIITKNFICNKAAKKCQREWNDLVDSIERNPHYQVLTKQIYCEKGDKNPPILSETASTSKPDEKNRIRRKSNTKPYKEIWTNEKN